MLMNNLIGFQILSLDVLGVPKKYRLVSPEGLLSPLRYLKSISMTWKIIPNELPTTTCKYANDCSQHELVSTGPNSKMQEVVNFLEDWAA